MAKKVVAQLKLHLSAANATPSPPVGPALGPYGINIVEFCKAYNAKTQSQEGMIIPVVVTVFSDRSFSFITKTPPVSEMLKKAANIIKGSSEPNKNKVGRIILAQIAEIAQTKLPDLNVNDLNAAIRTVEGTARSMGIEIIHQGGE